MSSALRYKKQCSVAIVFIIVGMVIFCVHNSVHAKQNIKMKTKNIVLVTGERKKLKVTGIKRNSKIRWKSSNKKIVSVSKKGIICAKKNGRAVVTAKYKNKKVKCSVTVLSKANAKQDKKEITIGTSYYRDFLVDNVYHSGKNGDIHYNVYFPDSYDGKKKMALYITLPGYQGLYFQGVAENLKTEDFGFEEMKYNSDMVILAPQFASQNKEDCMKVKQKIKILDDICMTILLFVLMAFHYVGLQWHEITGAAMLVLFILHHILNGNWYKALQESFWIIFHRKSCLPFLIMRSR